MKPIDPFAPIGPYLSAIPCPILSPRPQIGTVNAMRDGRTTVFIGDSGTGGTSGSSTLFGSSRGGRSTSSGRSGGGTPGGASGPFSGGSGTCAHIFVNRSPDGKNRCVVSMLTAASRIVASPTRASGVPDMAAPHSIELMSDAPVG